MARNNPNGANGVVTDPRQSLFIAYYLDPKSLTFSNALQSALKAGYAQNYAENIMDEMPDWLREKLGNVKSSRLLEKAERNLDEILDLPSKVQAMGPFGPIFEKGKGKKPVMVYANTLLKIKNDASQFVAERVGKKKYGTDSEDPTAKILIINISNQSGLRYGIDTSPSKDSD
jgi:hypothetical protein